MARTVNKKIATHDEIFELRLTVSGQCPSGKNAVIVTRTGHRFPAKRFVKWRTDALAEIKIQLTGKSAMLPLSVPVHVSIDYWAGDLRRRDVPGIIDALWHLLECCLDCKKLCKEHKGTSGVISDDTFLGGRERHTYFFNNGLDRKNPRVELLITCPSPTQQQLKEAA